MDYSIITKKKEYIRNKINSIIRDIDTSKYWITLSKSELSDIVFAGGDGSYNKRNYTNYCLYVVGSVSYINKVGGKIGESLSLWDVDIILPYSQVSNRLRLYMTNLELKTTLWNFINKDIDYYLFDGSLYSLIIQTHTYNANGFLKGEFDKYKDELLNKIYSQIESGEICPTVDYGNDLKNRFLFEQLEYIVLLTEIFKKYGDKFIGISKTSKMSLYFSEYNIPDMGIFQNNIKNKGYSKPLNLCDKSIKDINKNVYDAINNFRYYYDLKDLYYQFVRLEDGNKPVLCITSLKELDEEILSSLSSISVGGYPYILKKSHDMVKIKDSDMERCAKILGIYDKIDRDEVL